jgi:virulence-associated protein VapD
MTTDIKDNLFVLIKSLTKSEKRQFKLYVGRMDSNEDSKFLNLFNLLDKMRKYDEKKIIESNIVTKQQLSNLKAHLYKQILISLRLNPQHKNVKLHIRSQIDFATILYQKGLYRQSLKILDKVKSYALKYDENTSAYEIVEFEKLIESLYVTRSLTNRTNELVTQTNHLKQINDVSSSLSNISLQLYEKLIKAGYAKSDSESKEIKSIFDEKIKYYIPENLGFREKLIYYQSWVWYSLLAQDFLSSYKYASKWIDTFNNKPEMINIHPVYYLKGYNFLLEALSLIKYPSKFKNSLDDMIEVVEDESFPVNQNLNALIFLYKYNNLFNLHVLEGTFKESIKIIPEVIDGIEKNKNFIDQHHIMLLYYKIACMYFTVDEFDKCIKYTSLIMRNKNIKMREDLQCFTRILNLIAHWEAGLDFNLDKIIKETYNYLEKLNDLHEVQKTILKYLNGLENIYPGEIKGFLRNLYNELKKYEDDPYEKRAFLYLDIISWLESKIDRKPLQNIIKEKAILNNRKEKQSTVLS